MSAIQNLQESWEGHSFAEIEAFVKSQFGAISSLSVVEINSEDLDYEPVEIDETLYNALREAAAIRLLPPTNTRIIAAEEEEEAQPNPIFLREGWCENSKILGICDELHLPYGLYDAVIFTETTFAYDANNSGGWTGAAVIAYKYDDSFYYVLYTFEY